MRVEEYLPLRGKWLRFLTAGLWFCVGVTLVLIGSTLTSPPHPLLGIAFCLGCYLCVRSLIYGIGGK